MLADEHEYINDGKTPGADESFSGFGDDAPTPTSPASDMSRSEIRTLGQTPNRRLVLFARSLPDFVSFAARTRGCIVRAANQTKSTWRATPLSNETTDGSPVGRGADHG